MRIISNFRSGNQHDYGGFPNLDTPRQRKMAYKLSCSLVGHSNDIRCCCSFMSGGQEVIVTGGRDGYIILWELGAGKEYELKRVIKNHTSFVNCLCIIPASPSSQRDEGRTL